MQVYNFVTGLMNVLEKQQNQVYLQQNHVVLMFLLHYHQYFLPYIFCNFQIIYQRLKFCPIRSLIKDLTHDLNLERCHLKLVPERHSLDKTRQGNPQ